MDRGVSPVVGVALLAFVVVVLSLAVGAAIPQTPAEPPPTAQLSVSVDGSTDRIALTHLEGDPLDVTELDVTVEVAGTPLAEQPPVPFFAAHGFESGPTGPFNSASPDTWRVGEIAGVRVASTNSPAIQPGSRVTVTVATDRTIVHESTTTAG
jgi:FlaG/FlaF family flagellin (archaellin)